MTKHKLEFDAKCKACDSTGLYVGVAERDGAAVVCHQCNGTGCHKLVVEYEDFEGRESCGDIEWVYRVNPGIAIGKSDSYALSDFGGISYEQWSNNGSFPPRTEDRRHTCPAWFYQSADYKKKPDWDECLGCGSFSGCKYFPNKHRCWERWDQENSQ